MESRKFLGIAFIISILTVIIWYFVIEPYIFKTTFSQDIFIFWNTLNSPLEDLYQIFGFIYPPFFWFEFHLLGSSLYVLNGFITITQILGFPLGLYLIQRKFQLKRPEFLMLIIYIPFIFDVALRNFNTFIFLICAIVIYLYDKHPFISGLLLLLVLFKPTTIILILFVFINNLKLNKVKYIIGIAISIFFNYIFFPISGFTIMNYIQKVIEGRGNSFNIFITISRIIHTEHMVWMAPVIFSLIFLGYKQNSMKFSKVDVNQTNQTPSFFYKSIIIVFVLEILVEVIGNIAYIKWWGKIYL